MTDVDRLGDAERSDPDEVEIPMRIRRHEDGCAAALTGAECAGPPDEEWVPASQLRGAVDRIIEWTRAPDAVRVLDRMCQGSKKAEDEFRDALARLFGGQ
jgi:hypothetical protein